MALAEQIPSPRLCGSIEELDWLVRGIAMEPEHVQRAAFAELFSTDLYALLRYGMGRDDVVAVKDPQTKLLVPRRADQAQWLFERAREVQAEPDGCLDLWAREHYKSTLLTFAGLIFRVIRNPELTIGIFSHSNKVAKKFLTQIKYELEANQQFHYLWPHIFYANPKKESPKWTENEGIVVRRKSNPKEATIEAHGLVDGMPTGRHFDHLHYDDVVVPESVTTPDMIEKTTAAFEMSSNLGSEGGSRSIIGTIYHYGDTYMGLIKKGAVKTRIYPCTKDGSENLAAENCVLQSAEYLKAKRVDQGPYTFGTQLLLNPKGDGAQSFKSEWLRYTRTVRQPADCKDMWRCILCDPANEKRKHNDWTCFWVVGIGRDCNYVVLDVVRDKLNLAERWRKLLELHQRWTPDYVGYERYGMQADVQHFQTEMEHINYRFDIYELGGQTPKPDRIKRLVPVFEQGKIYLPPTKSYTNYEQMIENLIETFIEQEYKAFPVMAHDDMFDCLARLEDPDVKKMVKVPTTRIKAPPKVITTPPNGGRGGLSRRSRFDRGHDVRVITKAPVRSHLRH